MLNWAAIFEMKLRWRVSASAILRRAYDLKILSADQYRTGCIHLTKTGQRKFERFDDKIAPEMPELLPSAMVALEQAYPGSVRRIADDAGIEGDMFECIAGLGLPERPDHSLTNVTPISAR
jgi:Zn-dependent peptidase ImmA (M78 family)